MVNNKFNQQFVIYKQGKSTQKVEKKLCPKCDINWISKRSVFCKSCDNIGVNNHFYNKHHTKETKNKISLIQQQVIRTHKEYFCIDCGIEISQYSKRCIICKGKTMIGENNLSKILNVRNKISLALRGENNGSWNGGTSFYPYGKEWTMELKEEIRERDNRICKVCGVPECECNRKLIVHHIDYNKNNNSEVNLISLCDSCHPKTNANRKYWEEYFTQLMISKIKI